MSQRFIQHEGEGTAGSLAWCMSDSEPPPTAAAYRKVKQHEGEGTASLVTRTACMVDSEPEGRKKVQKSDPLTL